MKELIAEMNWTHPSLAEDRFKEQLCHESLSDIKSKVNVPVFVGNQQIKMSIDKKVVHISPSLLHSFPFLKLIRKLKREQLDHKSAMETKSVVSELPDENVLWKKSSEVNRTQPWAELGLCVK